ncbi:BON domain-containing protein [Cupriavidus malaysiensis]|uniref:BON domain-containing protein n=1 Tax=Cupriavidus malaysiensis TaxID=367825 RepID=A0ABM6FFA1_9BURK|nr:BON domain-containing protein [Cupriavidus malaysiensis]AOZ10592.1 hypothetical protein BKK80_34190 [Cupriavidus malaysiensis]
MAQDHRSAFRRHENAPPYTGQDDEQGNQSAHRPHRYSSGSSYTDEREGDFPAREAYGSGAGSESGWPESPAEQGGRRPYPYRDRGRDSREYGHGYDYERSPSGYTPGYTPGNTSRQRARPWYEEEGLDEASGWSDVSMAVTPSGPQRRHPENRPGRWQETPPRRVAPKGYQRSDERIREDVCERLAYCEGIDVSDVSVEVDGGMVTLSGSVAHRGEKYTIEDVADDVFGVKEVSNQIRVRRESGGPSASSRWGASATSASSTSPGSTASGQAGGPEAGKHDVPPPGRDAAGSATRPGKPV